MDIPQADNDYQREHVHLLCDSYKRWIGKALFPDWGGDLTTARKIFEAPFVLLSHNTDTKDPLLNYSNRTGLNLFEISWKEMLAMPSRLTAEPKLREERDALMKRVTDNGYIDDYSGVRISKTGKRFFIEQATVWNLIDNAGIYCGQAAMFSNWAPLS